jgi:hypothetical protein
MIKYVFIIFICTGISLTAQEKKDIELKTEVSEVTVFIKGAQIVRRTSAGLPAGKSTLRFSGLSPYIDAKSIQVKMDGELMILSVNHQFNYNDSIRQTGEIKRQTKLLEELNEKIQLKQISKEIIKEELLFLHENKKIGGTAEGVDLNNLKATSIYYGERIASLKMKEIETDKQIRTLFEEKNIIERQIAVAGATKHEPAGEIVITVDCPTALNIPVELSYYVSNAFWYPSYDIRAKSISDPVELVYKANIMQNTKETWKDVNLKVSSVNPNLGNVTPKLKTYFLNYYTPPPRYEGTGLSNQVKGKVTEQSGEALAGVSVVIKGTTIGTVTDMNGNFSLSIPAGSNNYLEVASIGFQTQTLQISDEYMNIVLEEETVALDEVTVVALGTSTPKTLVRDLAGHAAGISTKSASSKTSNTPLPVMQIENTTSVEFEVKVPYTIPSENKNTAVELERYSIPAEYEYYCVPKVDRDAFLLANISGWEQYSLLEGEANIFFENTFVGKTVLDVRYVNDTLSLSLGRDKSVSVQRNQIKEYTAKKFLGSKAETSRDWKITVKNNKRQPVSIVLYDQIPVSTMNEIEVTAETLSNGSLNRETGEVKWKITLPPAQKNEIELKYKVKYPKNRTLPVE